MSDRRLVFVPREGDEAYAGVCHYYDGDPTVSLCGLDISEYPEVDEDYRPVCVVCEDLDRQLPVAAPAGEISASVLRDLVAIGLVGIRPEELPLRGESYEQTWGRWLQHPLEVRWFCIKCGSDWTIPRARTLDEGAICPECHDADRWPHLLSFREVA